MVQQCHRKRWRCFKQVGHAVCAGLTISLGLQWVPNPTIASLPRLLPNNYWSLRTAKTFLYLKVNISINMNTSTDFRYSRFSLHLIWVSIKSMYVSERDTTMNLWVYGRPYSASRGKKENLRRNRWCHHNFSCRLILNPCILLIRMVSVGLDHYLLYVRAMQWIPTASWNIHGAEAWDHNR